MKPPLLVPRTRSPPRSSLSVPRRLRSPPFKMSLSPPVWWQHPNRERLDRRSHLQRRWRQRHVAITTNAVNVTVGASSVSMTGSSPFQVTGVEAVNLTGGAAAQTFDISAWTAGGSINGAGGSDTLVMTKDTDMTLTNGGFTYGTATTKFWTLASIESAGPHRRCQCELLEGEHL